MKAANIRLIVEEPTSRLEFDVLDDDGSFLTRASIYGVHERVDLKDADAVAALIDQEAFSAGIARKQLLKQTEDLKTKLEGAKIPPEVLCEPLPAEPVIKLEPISKRKVKVSVEGGPSLSLAVWFGDEVVHESELEKERLEAEFKFTKKGTYRFLAASFNRRGERKVSVLEAELPAAGEVV